MEFCQAFDYIKRLKFDENPDYSYLINCLKSVLKTQQEICSKNCQLSVLDVIDSLEEFSSCISGENQTLAGT